MHIHLSPLVIVQLIVSVQVIFTLYKISSRDIKLLDIMDIVVSGRECKRTEPVIDFKWIQLQTLFGIDFVRNIRLLLYLLVHVLLHVEVKFLMKEQTLSMQIGYM